MYNKNYLPYLVIIFIYQLTLSNIKRIQMVKSKVRIGLNSAKYWEEQSLFKELFYLLIIFVFLNLAFSKGKVTISNVYVIIGFSIIMFLLIIFLIRKLWIFRSHEIIAKNDGTVQIIHRSLTKTEKKSFSKQEFPFLKYYSVEEYVLLQYLRPEKNKFLPIKRYISWRAERNQKNEFETLSKRHNNERQDLFKEDSTSIANNVLSSPNSIEILRHKSISKKDLEKINTSLTRIFNISPVFAARIYVPFNPPVIKERKDAVLFNTSFYSVMGQIIILLISYVLLLFYQENKIQTKYKSIIFFKLSIPTILIFAIIVLISNILFLLFIKYKELIHSNRFYPSQKYFFHPHLNEDYETNIVLKSDSSQIQQRDLSSEMVDNGFYYRVYQLGLNILYLMIIIIFNIFFLLVTLAIISHMYYNIIHYFSDKDTTFLQIMISIISFSIDLLSEIFLILLPITSPLIFYVLYIAKKYNMNALFFSTKNWDG